MRTSPPHKLVRVGCLALLVAVAACQGLDNEASDESGEISAQPRASALTSGGLGAGGATTETLATYTAKCEAATGIHVPDIDCTKGTEVPQGSSTDNLETDQAIPSTVSGSRVPNQPVTAQSITAGGSGLSAAADSFFFSSVSMGGSGTAEVHIASLTNPTPQPVAGLMLRQSSAPGSKFMMVGIVPGVGAVFRYRLTDDTTVVTVAPVTKTAPVWLRLLWGADTTLGGSNSKVAGFVSSDRVTWTQVGTISWDISTKDFFPATGAQVGVAVSAHSTVAGATTTVAFDTFVTNKHCDRPNVLNGQCDPRSKFQVASQTSDAVVVANCRKESLIDDKLYLDIAVIQYNRINGAICYYQSANQAQDGSHVTAPSSNGTFQWVTPAATHAVGCPACHDNGPFIRSQYIKQIGKLPSPQEGYDNVSTKLRYVGLDFALDKTWSMTAKQAATDTMNGGGMQITCNGCHRLSVNNGVADGSPLSGTGADFAVRVATAENNVPNQSLVAKNPNSQASPIWMRPFDSTYPPQLPYVYNQGAHDTALAFQDCATRFWGTPPNAFLAHGFADGYYTTAGDPCTYTLFGYKYPVALPASTDQVVPSTLTGGLVSGSYEFATVKAPANTDVYNATDSYEWTYVNLPGDGSFIVKVTSLAAVSGATDGYAKAGIMIRDGLAANAANVVLAITKSNGATFQYRATAGASVPTPAFLTGRSVPVWLKLTRAGKTFVGSVSSDNGATWAQVGAPVTLANMNGTYAGIFTTAHTGTAQPVNATFASFDWTATPGWTASGDTHVFADANIGGAGGGRTEAKLQDTIASNGGDIFANADQFSYAFKTFAGDGVAVTKVVSQGPSPGFGSIDPYAKAGIMVRDNADPAAPNVFVGKTPSGAAFQNRPTAAATTTVTNVSSPATPLWFRMTRAGNQFTGAMSTDGKSWSPVGDPFSFSSFSASPLVGLAVSSHHATNSATAVFDSGAGSVVGGVFVPATDPPGLQWLPGTPAWMDASFGNAGGSHASDPSAMTEVITASGTDIYNAADQFFFAFKNITGNATITAKVIIVEPVAPAVFVNTYAKAGIMIRDSATAGAPNALMAMTSAQGATFQYRAVAGQNVPPPVFLTTLGGNPVANPYFVRLIRSGATSNTYTGQVSSNGTAWTTVSSTTMSTIGPTALVGLAVTSHDASMSVKATIANFALTQP